LNRDLERRVAERTAELEAANRELESFSYTVSHDLRAPLRTLDGFSDALLEDYGPQLPAEARDYLATIRRGAQRMGALIDDLLAFSRLSRKPLTKQSVNMEALVQGALEELGPERTGRKIEFLNGALPATQGDPALLKQVWMNLLSNAIKYSRQAEQARIEIGSLAEPGAKVYFVRDNGAGFDMKYADKLFGVFQRLHRADEFEGTGIGLATVQRIVHRHGGRVWAEAQPDQGATFYFTLEREE
jgi:light-regulated signal transduction histidine kinase (bacteriophytochrome)